MEKSVPRDHRLSSLVMPNDDPREGFFYPTLTLMIDSYILRKTFTDSNREAFEPLYPL